MPRIKPKQSEANAERAEIIEDALITAFEGSNSEELVIDALAHLRHLCDKDGHTYADLDRQAHRHYLNELHES